MKWMINVVVIVLCIVGLILLFIPDWRYVGIMISSGITLFVYFRQRINLNLLVYKITGTKYQNYPLVFKKYYCPICGAKLNCIKRSKIVNSQSSEASHWDFRIGDKYLVGDVRFAWKEFQCENCKKVFPVEEIRRKETA